MNNIIILDTIGQGAFSEVIKVKDTDTKEILAMKLIPIEYK